MTERKETRLMVLTVIQLKCEVQVRRIMEKNIFIMEAGRKLSISLTSFIFRIRQCCQLSNIFGGTRGMWVNLLEGMLWKKKSSRWKFIFIFTKVPAPYGGGGIRLTSVCISNFFINFEFILRRRLFFNSRNSSLYKMM